MSSQQPVQAQMPTLPAVGVFAPQKGNVDYFAYPFKLAAIAHAVVQQPVNVQISTDSDFYWNATTYQVDISTAAQTNATRVVPAVSFNINDQGSNRTLFNDFLPIASVCGFGNEPYRLVHPRLFTRGTTVTMTFNNYSAAEDYTNLYVVLHGFKVYGTP